MTTHKPLVMGILNVTPDSFSDGGLYLDVDAALEHVAAMVEQGADIIDIGGESTRPGSRAVSYKEELERVVPIIQKVAPRFNVQLSIDTRHFEVAQAAADAGVSIINDVSGGSDIRMADLVRDKKLNIVLMHMQGNPQNMQSNPSYPRGVVNHVRDYLFSRVRAFAEFDIPKENLWVDPGFGFGKTLAHNLQLLNGLDELIDLGGRLVVGTSRKTFLSRVLGEEEIPFEKREPGTIATNLMAYTKGASIFRVHDVGSFKSALKTWEAAEHAG